MGSGLNARAVKKVNPQVYPGPTLIGMSLLSPPCPCGTGHALADCCGRWHAGAQHLHAPDALALMRSRYSAYALGLSNYLLATWHASTRPATLDTMPPGLKWLGLEVRRFQATGPHEATVEFVARSKLGGKAHRLHETSHFVLEAGHWWYVDGQVR